MQRNVPWFKEHLRRLVSTKQHKYIKNKNNASHFNFTKYENYCKFGKSKIFSLKKNFDKRKFLIENTNSKQFLNYINSITKPSQPAPNLFHNNRTVTLDSEKQILYTNSTVLFL